LYSSLLATWRRERANGIPRGVDFPATRAEVKRNQLEEGNRKLRRQLRQLTENLRKAEIIIEIAALLGNPIPEPDPEETQGRKRGPLWMPAAKYSAMDSAALK
jgi:hypothetical protein